MDVDLNVFCYMELVVTLTLYLPFWVIKRISSHGDHGVLSKITVFENFILFTWKTHVLTLLRDLSFLKAFFKKSLQFMNTKNSDR